jgi:hypothetical protein
VIYNFDNIDVAINHSGIISTNASINTTNSIEPAYVLGYSKPINQLPFGPIKTTLNSSYIPVIDQEPNYAEVNRIKSLINDSGFSGINIEFAGLHHDCWYLDGYSLKVQPNNLVEAGISYSTFWELCGTLREKSNRINYLDEGSLIHSWAAQLSGIGDIYDFSYDFKVNWQPVYIIGRRSPIEVKLLSAAETISFNIDSYRRNLFTGENVVPNIFNENNGNLYFQNLSIICNDGCTGSNYLTLNVSGFKIKNISPAVQVGEVLRTSYVANRYY